MKLTVAEPILRDPPRRNLDSTVLSTRSGLSCSGNGTPNGALSRSTTFAQFGHEVLIFRVELGLGRRGWSAKAAGGAALLEAVACHVTSYKEVKLN